MNNKTILSENQIERIASIDDYNRFTLRAHEDMLLARAIEQAVLQSEQVQAWKRDAERYGWLKENIMEQYNLPGSYYLPDDAPEVWDRTIDAAMEQQK